MKPRKFRWSKVYESSEEELQAFLKARGLTTTRVHDETGNQRVVAAQPTAITIWCAEGSLIVTTEHGRMPLQTGDALALPPHTDYTIQAGIAGCVCYEQQV